MENFDFHEPHLSDSLKVLFRRRKIILIIALLSILVAIMQCLRMYPIYYSTATVMLEGERGTSVSFTQPSFPDYGWVDEKWVNTQIKVINSRGLAKGIVKRLGLRLQTKPEAPVYKIFFKNWIPENLLGTSGAGIQVKPVSVSGNAKEGQYRGIFQNSKNFTLYDDSGNEIGKGEIHQPFLGTNFSFIVKGQGSEGKNFAFDIHPESSVTHLVMDRLMVSMVKNSNLINVGAKWEDPELARDIANAAVEEYKATLISRRTSQTSQILSFIESQLSETEKDLQAAEENLRKFKEKGKVVFLDAQVKKTLEQVTDYEKEYRTAENYRKQTEILLSAWKNQGEFSDQKALYALGTGLNNDYLKELSRKQADLFAQRSSLATLLKEEHPKIKALDREIESVKNSMVNEVAAMASTLRVREANYLASLKKIEENTQKLPSIEKELFGLERVAKVGQGINLFLLQKRAELSINKASMLANLHVIDPAINGRYAEPDIVRKIFWALLIGTVLGISSAFFLEYFDTTVKTPEQIQRITQLPYLGTIYHDLTDSETPNQELKMLESPYSHTAEAFRTIKTNLLYYCTAGEPKKFILITSSGPSEGKTFITANLGVALAQSGKKILMVEADLRNPGLHKIFGAKRSPGLTSTLLTGAVEYSHLPIQKTPLENLKFIAAGEKSTNPSELLCSDKMERFFSSVRDRFDYILLDSPPAYLTSDPLVLAQKVDGVVFVARSGEVKREVFRETLVNFLKIESKMLGIVFNDMNREMGKYYYYKYSYYYEEGENGRERKKRRIRSSRMRKLYPGNYGGEKNTGKYLRPH